MVSKQDKFFMISKETLLLDVYLEMVNLMKGKQQFSNRMALYGVELNINKEINNDIEKGLVFF